MLVLQACRQRTFAAEPLPRRLTGGGCMQRARSIGRRVHSGAGGAVFPFLSSYERALALPCQGVLFICS